MIENLLSGDAHSSDEASPSCGWSRASKRLSPATRKVYEDVRALFPAFVQDQPMYEQMKRVQDYLRSVEENID